MKQFNDRHGICMRCFTEPRAMYGVYQFEWLCVQCVFVLSQFDTHALLLEFYKLYGDA